MSEAKIAFEMRTIRLKLDVVLPVRQVKEPQKTVERYKTIVDSIKSVGLVEPLMVHPQGGKAGTYILVDGHLRYSALRELGETEADCIVANDDESFTYNARVSRLAPIQEHKMILKAVKNGVNPERIAAALNIPVRVVLASMRLLDGIHHEAAELLKDKVLSPKVIRMLKKVTPARQIEIAEMMVSLNNFSIQYGEALIWRTPKDQLVNPEEPKKETGLSPQEVAKLEEEMETLERDMRAVEGSYGENMLNLTVAHGYIRKLIDNAKVVRFLNANHPEILAGFESIAATEML